VCEKDDPAAANCSRQRGVSLTWRSAVAKEVCAIITVHAKERFSYKNRLVAPKFFYTENSQKFQEHNSEM
jgi:hypothetical protein